MFWIKSFGGVFKALDSDEVLITRRQRILLFFAYPGRAVLRSTVVDELTTRKEDLKRHTIKIMKTFTCHALKQLKPFQSSLSIILDNRHSDKTLITCYPTIKQVLPALRARMSRSAGTELSSRSSLRSTAQCTVLLYYYTVLCSSTVVSLAQFDTTLLL
jgi:hypothetical protein